MSKRIISDQQKKRIHHIQKRQDHPDNQHATIIAHYGKSVVIETDDHQLHHCRLRQNLGSLVVGDRIVWDKKVIVAQLPRTSELIRLDDHQKLKPIAANIDQILIVTALLPECNPFLIDSYLVATEFLNIPAVIIFNKMDLIDSPDHSFFELIKTYESLGYPVIQTSIKKSLGLDALQAILKNKCSVLVGESGVGKSSLIKKLIPDLEIETQALSEIHQHGQHTTTTARRYKIADLDAYIIDSPGIREFTLGEVNLNIVQAGFVELKNIALDCRFRNCRHQHEPNCAVQKAWEENKISPTRINSYQKFLGKFV